MPFVIAKRRKRNQSKKVAFFIELPLIFESTKGRSFFTSLPATYNCDIVDNHSYIELKIAVKSKYEKNMIFGF